MDKKTVKILVNIIVGIAILTVIYSFCSLIFNAISARDPILIDSSVDSDVKAIVNLATWMMVALVCLLVPTLVCYGFSLFGKSKIMTVVSAVMSFFVVATALSFFFVLRENAFTSNTAYTIAAAAYTQFVQLLAACTLTCVFFTYESVFILKDFIKTKSKNTEQVAEQSQVSEQTEDIAIQTEILPENKEEENKNEKD